mgnify:CR=1 FL=1
MSLHLDDKHVLVTGGSRSIGFACAEGFLLCYWGCFVDGRRVDAHGGLEGDWDYIPAYGEKQRKDG